MEGDFAEGQFSGKVRCELCGQMTHYARCRSISKNAGTWRCHICGVRHVQLRRIAGVWPFASFAELAANKREDFYKRIAALGCKEIAKELETLVTEESLHDYFKEGGRFLPLSVYERDGYDVEAIKKNTNAKDIMQHPVLGTVYRVSILDSGVQGFKGTRKTTKASASGAKKRMAEPLVGESEDQPLAIMDGTAKSSSSSSNDSSDSSDSSSSSNRKSKNSKKKKAKKDKKKAKKNKKDKKGKKDKKESPAEAKARAALEKAQAREAEKNATRGLKLAQSILSKIEPAVAGLEQILGNAMSELVPAKVADPVRVAAEALQALAGKARKAIKDGDFSGLPDVKEVQAQICTSNRDKALMHQIMGILSKS